ncbi:MAG: hypothetical protein QXK24_05245 [Ignisphaera sp.]
MTLISLDQVIYTHNHEYKYISSDPSNTELAGIQKKLYSIFNNVYDLGFHNGLKGHCIGQINIKIDEKKNIGIVYFEAALGHFSKRPFIHMHAIIVDEDTYIKNNLNFIYFKDKFINYSKIIKCIDTIPILTKVNISTPISQYLNEENLKFMKEKILNGKLDIKTVINYLLSILADKMGGQLILKANSEVEAIDLAGILLTLLPPNIRANISVLAGAMARAPMKVMLIINSANKDNRIYHLHPIKVRNFKICDEIVEAIMAHEPSVVIQRINQIHQKYLNDYERYKPYFGDDANIMLLNEELMERVREEKRIELLNKTLQAIRSDDLITAKTYHDKMKILNLLRNEESDLKIECLFAVKSGHPSLQDLFMKYDEKRVFATLEHLLRNGEITEIHLINFLDLLPIIKKNEFYKNHYRMLYKTLYKLYIKEREDLSDLYNAYKDDIIKKEELMEKFFSKLNRERLDAIDSSNIMSSSLYRKLIEILELKKKYGDDPIIGELVSKYIERIKNIMVIKTWYGPRKFSANPLKVLKILISMPEDSIFNLLLKIAEFKDLKSFYEDIIKRAFEEIINEKR